MIGVKCRDLENMFLGIDGLRPPCEPAVGGLQYPAVRAGDPSGLSVCPGKRDAVKVIAGVDGYAVPVLAAICRHHDRAARPDRDRVLGVTRPNA